MGIYKIDNFDCGLGLITGDAVWSNTHKTGNKSAVISGTGKSGIFVSLNEESNYSYGYMMVRFESLSLDNFNAYIGFRLGNENQCLIMFKNQGYISIYVSSQQAISSQVLQTDTWYGIGWEYYCDNTSGFLKVYVNDVLWVEFAGDTQALATQGINNIRLYGGATVADTYLDSYVLADDERPHVMNIQTITPGNDAAPNELTPSTGSDHYAVVDESFLDTTDYLYGTAAGKEMFGKSSWPSYTNIIALQVNVVSKRDADAPDYVIPILRSGGTDYEGDDKEIPTVDATIQHQCWEEDPATSAAFASLTDKAFGFRIY